MSDATYHTTRQDLRKEETRTAQQHGGKIPADSDVSQMKSIIDQNTDKSKEIDQTKANLPLPKDPPVASDWNSSDQRTVNVGSGRFEGPTSSLPTVAMMPCAAPPLLAAASVSLVNSCTRTPSPSKFVAI
ncbi:hypothetical protein N7450_009033 [Penicillium hetheringtonii]|uniref:Uncharacterized protein n=1 Tax=Penicillium hetheringtonii TaxID=911720 RepID=A0AAD6DE67_9EURO|nr:hypothetical protein N7450_009033 [Penicillium hetheringtonii]